MRYERFGNPWLQLYEIQEAQALPLNRYAEPRERYVLAK